ncbi:MAG: cadherin-like domain-containing protein [candidate division Zixibacteria bacterium]|nr:cadherin-like domain-containing protein [candidate division Zixibacteria bacterium]
MTSSRTAGILAMALATALLTAGRIAADVQDDESNHLIAINEVYTNSDGTLQFVELMARAAGQTNLAPTHVDALNADGTVTTLVFDFTASFPALDSGETILLATQGVADALGFAPDFIIPAGKISITNGRVIFKHDGATGTIIDAVAYGSYTGGNFSFGLPADPLPSDGIHSLQRVVYNLLAAGGFPENSTDWINTAVNSPRRNDGMTGIIQLSPQPPVLSPIGNKSVNEGQLLSFNVTATDPNGTIPFLNVFNLPTGAGFVDHLNGIGTFTWTPTYIQSGVYTNVKFIASDPDSADSESITITVNEITNPPVARDSSASGLEDTPFAARLQAFDPDGNPLTYTILSGPFNGAATGLNTSTGAFNYNPAANVNGNDSLTFRVNDGIVNSNTAKWRVTVAAVNDPPVAGNVQVSTMVNTPVSVGAMPVTDVDNATWTITQTFGPHHGAISNFNPATGSFDFFPELDYQGRDTILYVADDGMVHASNGQSPSNVGVITILISAGCNCLCHADPQCDGVPNILDVVLVIGVAFRGANDTVDPSCTHIGRCDVNCDCHVDVLDVVGMVNHAFRGDATPFCSACLQPCP